MTQSLTDAAISEFETMSSLDKALAISAWRREEERDAAQAALCESVRSRTTTYGEVAYLDGRSGVVEILQYLQGVPTRLGWVVIRNGHQVDRMEERDEAVAAYLCHKHLGPNAGPAVARAHIAGLRHGREVE